MASSSPTATNLSASFPSSYSANEQGDSSLNSSRLERIGRSALSSISFCSQYFGITAILPGLQNLYTSAKVFATNNLQPPEIKKEAPLRFLQAILGLVSAFMTTINMYHMFILHGISLGLFAFSPACIILAFPIIGIEIIITLYTLYKQQQFSTDPLFQQQDILTKNYKDITEDEITNFYQFLERDDITQLLEDRGQTIQKDFKNSNKDKASFQYFAQLLLMRQFITAHIKLTQKELETSCKKGNSQEQEDLLQQKQQILAQRLYPWMREFLNEEKINSYFTQQNTKDISQEIDGIKKDIAIISMQKNFKFFRILKLVALSILLVATIFAFVSFPISEIIFALYIIAYAVDWGYWLMDYCFSKKPS